MTSLCVLHSKSDLPTIRYRLIQLRFMIYSVVLFLSYIKTYTSLHFKVSFSQLDLWSIRCLLCPLDLVLTVKCRHFAVLDLRSILCLLYKAYNLKSACYRCTLSACPCTGSRSSGPSSLFYTSFPQVVLLNVWLGPRRTI